jgi:hypothetical protein
LRTTFNEREHQFEIRFSVMQTYENQRLEVDLCPQIVDQVGCIEISSRRLVIFGHSFVVRPMWFGELLAAVPGGNSTAGPDKIAGRAKLPVQTERPIRLSKNVIKFCGVKNDCNIARTGQTLLEEHRHHTVYAVEGYKVEK